MTGPRVLVLGASGRIGAMLRRHWRADALTPIWQARQPDAFAEGVVFDPLDAPETIARRCGPVDVVLGLAGVVPGSGDLSLNTALGHAALDIGAATGAKRVFLASSAAVYGPSDQPLREDVPPCPANPYGRAKARMEQETRATARTSNIGLTILRIGNVAGADALLAQPGTGRVLDRFADGQGPRRSYIGPRALADVLAHLVLRATNCQALPAMLNIALPGAVGMDALCSAAGLTVSWRAAPNTALPIVELDVRALQSLVPLPAAQASAIIADWQSDKALS